MSQTDKLEVSPRTGIALATRQTNTDSDVILGKSLPIKAQHSVHFRTCSNIMMHLTIRPKMSQTCSIGTRSTLLAGHNSMTMFYF